MCVLGNVEIPHIQVSYSGACPWQAYRICQELKVDFTCTDSGLLTRLSPPGVARLRRPSCTTEDSGFSSLNEFALHLPIDANKSIRGVIVRGISESSAGVIDAGTANFDYPGFNFVQWLALYSCRVTSFRWPASWASTLAYLCLVDNAIPNLLFAASLPALIYLDVRHNEIQTLKGIEALLSLKTLLLSFNFIHELEPLKGLNMLHTLYVDHNCLSNPRQIFHLRSLQKLRALSIGWNAFCRKRKVAPFVLYYLSGRLTMLNGHLVTKSDVEESRKMFDGIFTVDMIVDRVGEEQAEFVRTLDMPHASIREARLSDEMRFEYLYSLNLEGNNLTTLDCLGSLKFLRVLCLNHNRIRKFSQRRPRSAEDYYRHKIMAGKNKLTRNNDLVQTTASPEIRDDMSSLSSDMHRAQLSSRSISSIPLDGHSDKVEEHDHCSRILTPPAVSTNRHRGDLACPETSSIQFRRQPHPPTSSPTHPRHVVSNMRHSPMNVDVQSKTTSRELAALTEGVDQNVTHFSQDRATSSPPMTRKSRYRTNAPRSPVSQITSHFSGRQSDPRKHDTVLFHSDIDERTSSTGRLPGMELFPSLEVLMLANNGIQKLPPLSLHRFPRLHTLFLQNNDISSTSGVAYMPALTALVLDNNRIKTIENETLSTCPKVRILPISDYFWARLLYRSFLFCLFIFYTFSIAIARAVIISSFQHNKWDPSALTI